MKIELCLVASYLFVARLGGGPFGIADATQYGILPEALFDGQLGGLQTAFARSDLFPLCLLALFFFIVREEVELARNRCGLQSRLQHHIIGSQRDASHEQLRIDDAFEEPDGSINDGL